MPGPALVAGIFPGDQRRTAARAFRSALLLWPWGASGFQWAKIKKNRRVTEKAQMAQKTQRKVSIKKKGFRKIQQRLTSENSKGPVQKEIATDALISLCGAEGCDTPVDHASVAFQGSADPLEPVDDH